MHSSRYVQAFVVCAALGVVLKLSVANGQLNETKEPPLEINVEVDGQSISGQIGSQIDIEISGKSFQMVV